MPTIGLEAGIVLLLLLPGFISARIVRSFCPRQKQTDFELVAEALIHTFVVVVVYSVVVRHMPFQVNSWVQDKTTHYSFDLFRWNLLSLLGIAVVWGLIVSVSQNRDWPWSLLRKVGATQQSARSSTWHDAFFEFGAKGYVQVELADGRYVLGYLRLYSHEAETPSLFLTDARWVGVDANGQSSVVKIPGSGVLLTKESGIVNVMFLDSGTNSQAQSATTTS